MHSEVYAELSIHGTEFDLDAVEAAIGVVSARTFREGDPIPGFSHATYLESGWDVKSTLPISSELSEHVAEVLLVVSDHAEIIKRVAQDFGLETTLCGVVYSYDGDRPPLVLEAEQIRQIAELGAAFWIDLYILDDDDEDLDEP